MDLISVLHLIISLCAIGACVSVFVQQRWAHRQLAELHHHLIHEIKGVFTDWSTQVAARTERMFEQHEKALRNMTTEMSDRIASRSEELIDRFCREGIAKFDVYVNEEKAKLAQWIDRIESADLGAASIEMAETALNQYPSSRALLDLLVNRLQPLTESPDWQVRKHALERMNRSLRVFLDNCSADDWHYARSLLMKNIKEGNRFVQQLEAQRMNQLRKNVEQLESLLSEIGNQSGLSPEDIQALQEADEAIDKRWLDKDMVLKSRYEQAAQKIIRLLQAQHDSEDRAVTNYNLEAVQAIRDAHRTFQAHEYEFKQGRNLERLSSLLGGWDIGRLHISAQVYYQAVYSEIFSKLSADAKPHLTKLILNEKKKKVS